MKKTHKLMAAVVALSLLAGIAGGVIALAAGGEPCVIYNGSAESFEFENANPFETNANVDLFPDIKGAMPGDAFTQKISVGVKNLGGSTVSIRLFAENPNAGYLKLLGKDAQELLHPAVLTVSEGEQVISETALSAAGGYDLGNFSGSRTKQLTVTLQIPLEAGNELSDIVAEIDWVFKASVVSSPDKEFETIEDGDVPLGGVVLDKTNHFGYIIGRGGSGVQPEENITRAEVATIFFRLLTDESRAGVWKQVNPYSDVAETAWYNNAVSTLTNGEILEGYSDGSFRPNAFITRAEFAVIATRFYDESGVYSVDAFTDISGSWARNYINRAAELSLISGYGDGTFRPNQPITRAEAMQLINNVLERHPVKEHLLPDMIKWVDNADEGRWYYSAVQEATNSHDYDFVTNELPGVIYEVWKELLPVRDWAALEKQWSQANSGAVVIK